MKKNLLTFGLLLLFGLGSTFTQIQAKTMYEIKEAVLKTVSSEQKNRKKHFNLLAFDEPSKMSRSDIQEAPLYFKGNLEEYYKVLILLEDELKNKRKRLSSRGLTESIWKFDADYSSSDKTSFIGCKKTYYKYYKEKFGFINKNYISKLSYDEQDKNYLLAFWNYKMIEAIIKDCFNIYTKLDNIKEPTEKLNIPYITQKKFPELVKYIINSKSMDNEERNYWFKVLPSMTTEQVNELRDILVTEKRKLDEIERKYSSHKN